MYCPLDGRSRQPMMCMNVDLPDPDGPVTATNSPRYTSSDAPRSARTSTSPTWYVLVRSRTEMTSSFMVSLPSAVAASAESAGSARPALRSHERITRVAGGARTCRRLGAGDHGGDDFGVRLQLVRIEDLGVGAVRDAEPQVDRLQLLVHVEPCAATALDAG